MDRRAVLSPAHRMVASAFAVHRLGTDGDDREVIHQPFWLCLYRDPQSYEVETLELTEVAFAIMQGIERRDATLTDVVRNAAEASGVEVDVAFVESLSALLADLAERGVLLGSLAD
jgi:hypothetical protein